MGGIVGKLIFDPEVAVSPATVQRMVGSVAHRSAGGHCAIYVDRGIALGACEEGLLSTGEVAQNESGIVRAVADSALSNAASLRQLLEGRGHVVLGSSDAELIAHAYEEWGDACIARFSGPFACAIWDESRRRLLLARDHFGVRPLYFSLRGGVVVFASEIRALLQDPIVGREWHPDAIDTYLALGYVPAPLTMHRCISKLEPAHTLVVDGHRLTTRPYWNATTSAFGSERDAIEAFDSGLRTSVASLLDRTDACTLTSGGLASTAVATMLPRGSTTITVGVEHHQVDLERVTRMAAHLRLRNETDVAGLAATDAATLLASLSDEPAADPAAVSQYLVCMAARRYANVALTGHGAAAFCERTPAPPLLDDALRHRLYTRRFSWLVREANAGASGIDAARAWLSDNQLAIADRVATATRLVLRHPFLDRDLRGVTGANVLRQVSARRLPDCLLPADSSAARQPAWLAEAVRMLVPALLFGERFDARGIFSRPALRALWDEHQSGRRDHARRLWAVLLLELWFREFIDDDAAAHPVEHAVLVRAA